MLLNLYLIHDYLPFASGNHLLSDPVLRTLEKTAVLHANEILCESTLYIVDPKWLMTNVSLSSGIKLFFTAPPEDDSRLSNIDYLYALEAIDPVDLLQELFAVFQKFNAWELNLHRAMLREDPLQSLGDCSLEFFRNPCGLYTSSFYILCYWEDPLRKTPLFQKEDRNSYLPDEDTRVLLMHQKFIDSWRTEGPQLLPSVDGDNFTCLYQNIPICGMNLARVVLNDSAYPFRTSDYAIIDFFTQFVTRILEMDNTPQLSSHPPFLDDLLLSLAHAEPCDESQLSAATLTYGWNLCDKFLCARVLTPQDTSIGSLSNACMRLETQIKGCCVLKDERSLLMLINLSAANQSRDQVISSLPYIQREYLLKFGYSNEFRDLRNLHQHYLQAGVALDCGEETDPHLWTYCFENYALQYALRNAQGILDAKTICHPGLLKLLEYDQSKGRNFAGTLRAYLENNMSVSQTIRKVFLQRASFQYQLQKILEITGANLDHFDTRMYLMLSYQLLDMEQERE
ncbi:MAG: helix-turn-helix domain-containing protein [Eubacteriales bacterium]|nr:helix-turn-helix domain-containing protein [Eubacteriales bacterium]